MPKTYCISPIIRINDKGNIEIAQDHDAFTHFRKVLLPFQGIDIQEVDPHSILGSFFRAVSLLSEEIVEDNPNFIRDRWSDLVARVFSDSEYQKIIGYTKEEDRHLFAQLFFDLNNLLGDPQKHTKPEERGLFYEIFLEYLQGKRGVLEGISDEDFYDDLTNNRDQIFELLKQGEIDSRFIIVLNYALLAYKDWVEQRFNLPKEQKEKKGPLTERIKKAQEERDQRIQKAAKSLFELFRRGGLSLEQMEKMILESAKELGIPKEELEEEIKKIREIYDNLETLS